MKWLFLLLLAANVAYYFLGSDTAPDATPAATTVAPGTPTILLLREAKQQGRYPVPARPPGADTAPRADSAAPTPDQTSDQTSAPTAEDLHKAVYPEAGKADATDPTSSQSSTAGGDDRARDASAPPSPSPDKAQALHTGPSKTIDAAATAQVGKQVTTTIPNRRTCFRVGPFHQVAAAKTAGRKMMKLGFRGRLLQSTAQQGLDYQVYLGPYNDPDERQFALDELTDSGIDNIRLGRGRHENTLLIANYPSRKQAKPMLATLQTLGYNPHVAKQSKPVRRFYLDLEALDGSGSPSPRDRLSTAFPGIGLKSSACRR